MKSVRGRPVLGVFGGSFDPPHLGHAMLPTYLRLRGLVDQLLVAPCADHPLGKVMRPFETRLAWTRIAMAPHADYVEVSAIEAELAATSEGPSYTVRLLDTIAARRPDVDVRLVVGSDIVVSREIDRWHQWGRIESTYAPIVVPRAGYSPPAQCVLPEVSSTEVREAVAAQDWDALDSWLPKDVLARLRAPARGAVWVIGRGNVAAHAAPWLRARGFEALALPGQGLATFLSEHPDLIPPAAVWVLVSDPHIRSVAQVLVASARLPPRTPVLHGAGALPAHDVLAPVAEAGGPVGTLHPICSLRKRKVWPSELARAGFGLEGDPQARDIALAFVGTQPWLDLQDLDASGRRAYHGACALAANHLSVLLHTSAEVLRGQGHAPDVVDTVLGVLLRSSLTNLLALGIPEGVTGPAARGDTAAIAAHLDALPPEARDLYAELSRRLEALVKR